MTEEEYMQELREKGDVLVRTVLDILKVRADPVTRTTNVIFRHEMSFSEELLLSYPLLVADVFLDNLARVAENELKTMLRTELLELLKRWEVPDAAKGRT